MERQLLRIELIRRNEVEGRVGNLKNGKAAGKDEVAGDIINGGGNKVVDWIWKLCNMTFESIAVIEDWRSAVIVPLCKGKGERTECTNYRGIYWLVKVWLEKYMQRS